MFWIQSWQETVGEYLPPMLPRILYLLLAAFALSVSAAETVLARKRVPGLHQVVRLQHDAAVQVMKDGRSGCAASRCSGNCGENNIEFVYSKDGSLFTPQYPAQFDAFISTPPATSRCRKVIRAATSCRP